MNKIRTCLVTGASSGIGAALAHALAHPGTMLHLSGRDQVRLEAVAASCRDRGAAVESKALEVCQMADMADWIRAAGPLDLVIANAGISGRSPQGWAGERGADPGDLRRQSDRGSEHGAANHGNHGIAAAFRRWHSRTGSWRLHRSPRF